jgi:hypothetical protein
MRILFGLCLALAVSLALACFRLFASGRPPANTEARPVNDDFGPPEIFFPLDVGPVSSFRRTVSV